MITQLPAELLEKVADYLPTSDLFNYVQAIRYSHPLLLYQRRIRQIFSTIDNQKLIFYSLLLSPF